MRGIAREASPDASVETVMSAPVITVHEHEDVYDAAAKMARAGCRRLPVVNVAGRLQGVVSFDDIAHVFMLRPTRDADAPIG